MPDDTMTTNPQAGTGVTQPQAGADNNQPLGEGQEPGAEVFDAKAVKDLRSEAASWRVKFQNADKRLKEIESGQLTEKQKIEQERDELRQERDSLAQEVRESKLIVAATKASAIYPDLVIAKVPADTDLSDKGALDKVIADLKKAYPTLFRQTSADGGAGNGNQPIGSDMNTLIRLKAGRS